MNPRLAREFTSELFVKNIKGMFQKNGYIIIIEMKGQGWENENILW